MTTLTELVARIKADRAEHNVDGGYHRVTEMEDALIAAEARIAELEARLAASEALRKAEADGDLTAIVHLSAHERGKDVGYKAGFADAIRAAAEIADDWTTDAQRLHGKGGPAAAIRARSEG